MLKARAVIAVTAAALLAGEGYAADLAAGRGTFGPPNVASPGRDTTRELRWDSGTASWLVAWYSGAGSWVGNDFDISTIKTYPFVRTVRVYSYPAWPNRSWDGCRIGIYSFARGVPGAMIWPTSGQGKFVKGNMPGYGWNDFAVNWALPRGVRTFLPAVEQFYNYPNCDAHAVDNNRSFLRHSWAYHQGVWQPNSNEFGYYNVMLRVVMDDEHNPGVAPTSIGRIKAFYY